MYDKEPVSEFMVFSFNRFKDCVVEDIKSSSEKQKEAPVYNTRSVGLPLLLSMLGCRLNTQKLASEYCV